MTEDAGPSDRGKRDDRALFAAARRGEHDSLAELRRRHRAVLRSVVVGYVHDGSDPDLIVEAALDHLDTIPTPSSNGGVPVALFALVREAAASHALATDGRRPLGLVDLATYREHPDLTGARRDQFLDAFAELGNRDQALLWFSAVEGSSPADLEARLPIGSADAAATATHRARSRLRSELAKRRASEPGAPEECRSYAVHLAALTDGTLTGSRAETVQRHANDCPNCQALATDLSGVTSLLLGVAAPAVQAAATETPLSASAAPLLAQTSTAALRPAPIVAAPVGAGRARGSFGRPRVAATSVLTVAAVLVVIGLVVFGLTRRTPDTDPNELAVFVATTAGGPTTTYVSIYAGESTSSVTKPTSTTKPKSKSKSKTTTTTRRPPGRTPTVIDPPAPHPGAGNPSAPIETTTPGPATSTPTTSAPTTTVPRAGSLAVTFAAAPGGNDVRLTVKNTATVPATRSRLKITVSGPGRVEALTGAGCVRDPAPSTTMSCTLGELHPGATWTGEFTLVDETPETTLTAKVTSGSATTPDDTAVWPTP